MVWYGMVWCGMVWYGTVVWYDGMMIWRDVLVAVTVMDVTGPYLTRLLTSVVFRTSLTQTIILCNPDRLFFFQFKLNITPVWYGMVWYGMVWYGMVWYGMIWYGMVWYGMV